MCVRILVLMCLQTQLLTSHVRLRAEMANDLTWVFRFTIEALVRIGGISGYMFYRRYSFYLLY